MPKSKNFLATWGFLPFWLLLTFTVLFRAPIPIDETRYLSVAWEMWLRDDFLVPYLNGQAYSHKPPMLFWLIHLVWAIWGVGDVCARMVGPIAALFNLILIRKLAYKLWPEHELSGRVAPWVLMSTLLWTLFASSTMFDVLITCWVLLAMLGVLDVQQGAVIKGWGLIAISIAAGLLAKGPVIFLHVLPTLLLMSLWARRESIPFVRLGLGMVLAIVAGGALALVWAIPAALSGGDDYAGAILWHQTADRTVNTVIHRRAFYWYLPLLPLFLFPWVFWTGFWQSIKNQAIWQDLGVRFCTVWLCATFLIFSILPSKQVHYLIPALPAFALLISRFWAQKGDEKSPADLWLPILFVLIGGFLVVLPGLSKVPWGWTKAIESTWGVAILLIGVALLMVVFFQRQLSVYMLSAAVVIAIFLSFFFFFKYNSINYDLTPAAIRVRQMDENSVPYVFVGNYQGQFQFLGRLTHPVPVIGQKQAKAWAAFHPEGVLISIEKDRPSSAVFTQGHREYWLVFRSARDMFYLKPL